MYTLVFIPGLMKNRKSWENVMGQESWAKRSNWRKHSKSCPLSSHLPLASTASPVSPSIPSLPLPSETGCPMLPISCLHRRPLTQTSYGLLQGKRERSERSFPYILVFQISLTSNTWRGELPYSRLLCFEHCQQIKGRLPPPWFWLQL